MTSYKIFWESISPYSTELQSDTIFGHFAWAIQYLKGTALLNEFIAELRQKPALVLSSAFPAGMLPLPALPLPPNLKDRFPEWDQYRKRLKSIAFISRDVLTKANYSFDWEAFFTHVIAALPTQEDSALQSQPDKPTPDLVFHNSIDRLSGTTSAGGGNLYAAETTFAPAGYKQESYLTLDSQSIAHADLEDILQYISDTGFGKDKSTGKGRFAITYDQFEFPSAETCHAWLNLSNMVPAATDTTLAYYHGFTKFGKLGGNFAVTETPYKYPVFIMKPGSVFLGNKPIGTVLTDVHPMSAELGIIQNLYSYAIPFRQQEVKDGY